MSLNIWITVSYLQKNTIFIYSFMTELLFNEDSYLKEAEATIISAADNIIKLNRTVFFPEGGGQPGDQGEIILKDRVLKVIDTKKDLQENEILHYVEGNIDESIINQEVGLKNALKVYKI